MTNSGLMTPIEAMPTPDLAVPKAAPKSGGRRQVQTPCETNSNRERDTTSLCLCANA